MILGIVFGALPGLTATPLGALMIDNVTPGPTVDPMLIIRIVAILAMASLTMFVLGLVSYALIRMDYSIAPLVIGVILGGLFDETFRRSLLISDGDLTIFVTRPGAAVPLTLNLLLILSQLPAPQRFFRRRFARGGSAERNAKIPFEQKEEA